MNAINISHFNPSQLDEANFLANFIARQNTLNYFLGELRNTVADRAARHHLIIAPRGYGKTSLLRRIQIALRTEPEFNTRFIALAFREEQHNVISLDVFWRNCIQSLLEAREDEHADLAEIDALDALWHQHAPRSGLKREEQDGAPAWTAFDDECRRLGRRPVLLVDNLDALLAGLEHHQWGLRTVLQQANGPVLIAAASRYPEQLSDHAAPFFDFFRMTTLPRLSDQEVMDCLRTLAIKRGPLGEPVRHLLETDVGRISALNTMAGGNPRTLGVLYTVLEAHMTDDVLAQLSAMLDTFTGWYQARTEELPLQSRAVFDALALNWDPMTAAALATVSGLETTAVSSHLSRLEKMGYVETVALSSTRKSRNGYQVAERFYNIWYLMRNGPRRTRQSIRWLTVFLSSCFSRRELHTMARDKLSNGTGRIESTLALAESLPHGRLRSQLLDAAESKLNNGYSDPELYALIGEMKQRDKPGSKKTANNMPNAFNTAYDAAYVAHQQGNHAQAEALLREAIALNGENALPWYSLGILLHNHLQRYEEAEVAYRRTIELNDKNGKAWNNLGTLLQAPLQRYEEAEVAYRCAIKLLGKETIPWNNLGSLLQDHLQRYEEAETAYRRAIELDEKYAKPWSNLGNLLRDHLQRYEEAEAAYRRAIELDEKYAWLWHDIGKLLQDKLGRYEEALQAYQSALESQPDEPSSLSNCAYIHALHLGTRAEAALCAQKAAPQLPPAGQLLLDALLAWTDNSPAASAQGWQRLNEALTSGDDTLWTHFEDDLLRLLTHAWVRGDGAAVRQWMEAANYPQQFAPLYHAFCAALDGADHLLTINPEVRGVAAHFYNEIARMQALFLQHRQSKQVLPLVNKKPRRFKP